MVAEEKRDLRSVGESVTETNNEPHRDVERQKPPNDRSATKTQHPNEDKSYCHDAHEGVYR